MLGTGKRLFAGGTVPAGFEVTSSQIFSSGVIVATYRSGAEIKYGTFAAEAPSEAELARDRPGPLSEGKFDGCPSTGCCCAGVTGLARM